MAQNGILDEIKERYKSGGILTRLIMINIGVFLLINLVRLSFVLMSSNENLVEKNLLFEKYLHYIMVPDSPRLLVKQMWSLVTYMFAHVEFLHILFNMFWLYWFGSLFKNYIGESKIYPVYIMGGLMGAFFFIAAYNIFPLFENVPGYAIGASAAVMAIVLATATMIPNYSMNFIFIGPVKLKWLAVFVVIFDIISIPKGNPGGHIAHLGGAFYGYLFALQYKNGNDWSKPFYVIWDKVKMLFDFSANAKKSKKSKVKMAYKMKRR